MKLAIYQSVGIPGDKAANLTLLNQQAQIASAQGADFLVLPELFLTGYNIGEALWELAEPFDGISVAQASAIARQHRIALLFGYPELSISEDGKTKTVYNACAFIDQTGTHLDSYRKIHLYGTEEKSWFTPGDRWSIHEIAGWRIGVLICFDVEFPETVRQLALAGADLIAIPTALALPYLQIPKIIGPARAIENQVFVAYANRCGQEGHLTYCGHSTVVAPDGQPLAIAGLEEELLIVTLDRTEITAARSEYCYLLERRTDLY